MTRPPDESLRRRLAETHLGRLVTAPLGPETGPGGAHRGGDGTLPPPGPRPKGNPPGHPLRGLDAPASSAPSATETHARNLATPETLS